MVVRFRVAMWSRERLFADRPIPPIDGLAAPKASY